MSADGSTLRLDLLLCRLRLAKTRSAALRLVDMGRMRCNGVPIARPSHGVRVGDVLTFAQGEVVRIVEIVAIPGRRGPAAEAQTHYRTLERGLDRSGQTAIAPAHNPPA